MVIVKEFSVDKCAEMFETKNMRKASDKMKGMHHNPLGITVTKGMGIAKKKKKTVGRN